LTVIDAHAHIISREQGALPPHTAEHLLDSMRRAGVSRAVLVQYSAAHGYDNSYVLDTVERHADRFVAVCTLDPRDASAPALLTDYVRGRGAAGVRVRAPDRSAALDWLVGSQPIWRRAADLGIPVSVHLQQHHHVAGVQIVRDMLSGFPTLDVVLDHVGNPPWQAEAPFGLELLEMLADHPRLVLKFATVNLNRLEAAHASPVAALERLIAVFGSARIMRGSDVPNTPGDYLDMVSRVLDLLSHVGAEDRSNILSGTALRVYPSLAQKEALDARLPVS
jgi:predicted TIM-barrel fold metal-dependent hydrolase